MNKKPEKGKKRDRREYMRKYMREWRARNPEKVAEYHMRYWDRQKEEATFR
ncbi:hypothetical protein [Ammoniphilus resinae]|uniref:Uncharacterized protein n=1 Tax=Ammoniphilus resinae TaxID=861532 RepID=A0ABS4GX93_9BACL|nr:hypothetical protein [Ammoniphilus resinae]MBP1934884.1 hypothetical protein [Ammoniphilus resinae]